MTALDAAILILGALFLVSIICVWAMGSDRRQPDSTEELAERLVADLQRGNRP
jgi:hypothetical protein